MSSAYTAEFFANRQSGSRRSADRVVPLIMELIHPRSVADIGCGTGTWLAAFSDQGVADIVGIDGDYVSRTMLQIPEERFLVHDLTKPISLDRRFDLVCCLEVAEHLAAESAGTLVKSMIDLSSVIVFSAAVPYQGGTNHLNEQWPDYWATLFREKGYSPVDCLRAVIWSDPDVEWWYAQNILIFVEQNHLKTLGTNDPLRRHAVDSPALPLSLIHPGRYLEMALMLRFCQEVSALVPQREPFILVDSQFAMFPIPNALPFIEREGVYWGNPQNDEEAIQELERMLVRGSSFIVFSWLSFWWLDYYSGLRDYLRRTFPCVRENECLIAFDLRQQGRS